jgi:hypothetical protein
VDNPVNRKYFITRPLSPVKYGKKFVNGNIVQPGSPETLYAPKDLSFDFFLSKKT